MNWNPWKEVEKWRKMAVSSSLHIRELEREIEEMKEKKPATEKPSHEERIVELECKLAKLWSALIEVKPGTGKEGLTKLGRTFGGKAGLR